MPVIGPPIPTSSGNIYCTVTQFVTIYDVRQMGMLGKDNNTRGLDSTATATIQMMLDICGSELDAALAGRWTLPIVSSNSLVPLVLTRWVAAKGAERMYARRSDTPKQVQADLEWADNFLNKLLLNAVTLTDANGNVIPRAIKAELIASDFVNGGSRFDSLPGLFPPASPTSVAGNGNSCNGSGG